MQVTPIKTSIVHENDSLEELIKSNVAKIPEKSVLVVTSKVVALAEGAVAPRNTGDKSEKWQVVKEQAELYTDPTESAYQMMLTVKDQILAVNAGIDESNADNTYVLFPEDSYASAARLWKFVREHYNVKDVGVLISDSKTFPLKWGTIGTALAHCGFLAVNDRRGELDLFGKPMQVTKENIAEALAVAANFEMGEVAEAKPLALIEDIDKVHFQDRPPTQAEIDDLAIDIADDVYAPVLMKAEWKQGGQYKKRAISQQPKEFQKGDDL